MWDGDCGKIDIATTLVAQLELVDESRNGVGLFLTTGKKRWLVEANVGRSIASLRMLMPAVGASTSYSRQ
jgi:hypothetical protein